MRFNCKIWSKKHLQDVKSQPRELLKPFDQIMLHHIWSQIRSWAKRSWQKKKALIEEPLTSHSLLHLCSNHLWAAIMSSASGIITLLHRQQYMCKSHTQGHMPLHWCHVHTVSLQRQRPASSPLKGTGQLPPRPPSVKCICSTQPLLLGGRWHWPRVRGSIPTVAAHCENMHTHCVIMQFN